MQIKKFRNSKIQQNFFIIHCLFHQINPRFQFVTNFQPLYLLQARRLCFSWPWATWYEAALCAPWRHQQLTPAAGGGSSWAPCHWGRRLGLTLSQWVLINIGECGQHVCPLSGLGACPIIMQTPTTTRLLRCTVGNPSLAYTSTSPLRSWGYMLCKYLVLRADRKLDI